VPDSLALTCPQHEAVLIPSPVQAGMLMCPDATCTTVVCLSGTAPSSPLTYLEQGAAERHELVRAHEMAGFSRSEAMQVLCTTISASIMKDSGHG
jgi:hypothetical protein